MAWTETTRPHYERRCPRYASDLTDAEWALIEPLMPSREPHRPAAQDGPARGCECSSLHGLGGLRMAALAEGFPAVFDGAEIFLALARRRICCAPSTTNSSWRRANGKAGKPARRPASSTANRSRPPKAAESGALMPARRSMGRKRHIVVDTLGLLVGLVVHAADIQDRDGAPARPEVHPQAMAVAAPCLR